MIRSGYNPEDKLNSGRLRRPPNAIDDEVDGDEDENSGDGYSTQGDRVYRPGPQITYAQEEEEENETRKAKKDQERRINRRNMLIGAVLVDGLQIGLDLFAGAGVVANRFVDIMYGSFLLYYGNKHSLLNQKTLMSLGATFLAEQIPIFGDVPPFWTLDVWYMFRAGESDSNTASKEDQEGGQRKRNNPPLNVEEVRLPRK